MGGLVLCLETAMILANAKQLQINLYYSYCHPVLTHECLFIKCNAYEYNFVVKSFSDK